MKKLITLFLIFTALLSAQSLQDITLEWGASPTQGVTGYFLYRMQVTSEELCTPALLPGQFSRIAQVNGLLYVDSNPPVGIWCYYATSTDGFQESGPSNMAVASLGRLPPLPPVGLRANKRVRQ